MTLSKCTWHVSLEGVRSGTSMLEASVLLSRELAWGLDMLPLAPIHGLRRTGDRDSGLGHCFVWAELGPGKPSCVCGTKGR